MSVFAVAFICGGASWIMVAVICGSISRSRWYRGAGYFKTFIFGRIPMSTFIFCRICAAFFS
jgi:hypothetical protein